MADIEKIERRAFNRWFAEMMANADGKYEHLPRWLKDDQWLVWQAARKPLLGELSRLREENRRQAAEAHSYLSQLLQPDEFRPTEPGTIRICPMRDGPCPHGLNCQFVGDGYMGYPCKEGWNGRRALSERKEGQADG